MSRHPLPHGCPPSASPRPPLSSGAQSALSLDSSGPSPLHCHGVALATSQMTGTWQRSACPPQCPSYQRQRGPPRGERGLAAKGAWRGRNGRRCPSALAAPPRQPPASPHRTVLATAAPPPGLSPRTCRHARHGQALGQAPRSALPPQSQLGCTNRTSFPAGTATDGGRHLACGRLLYASFQQSASSSSAGCLCFCSLLSSQHLTQSLAH